MKSQHIKGDYKSLSSAVQAKNLSSGYIPIDSVDDTWVSAHVRQETPFARMVRRIFELIYIPLLFVVTSPFWVLIALSIKIEDGGHVFYKQHRVGYGGEEFTIYKFRSMVENAENGKAMWAQKNDSRITRTGKFIRATHLDELPQLFNIFKGDITLVGPRPERPEFTERLAEMTPYYYVRHMVYPGLMGWAQLKLGYTRDYDSAITKLEYDLFYIQNRNLIMDISIVAKTLITLTKEVIYGE